MSEVTVEQARDRARRAREAFEAAGGVTARDAGSTDSTLTCVDLHMAAAMAWWQATQALLSGAPEEYVAFYNALGEAYHGAAKACDAAAR